MNRLNLQGVGDVILLRPLSIAAIAASTLLFGCYVAPFRDLPDEFALGAISDWIGMSTREDFLAYVASYPQFCSQIESRSVCFLDLDGRFFDLDGRDPNSFSGWRRLRYGVADMDGATLCRYHSADFTGDGAETAQYHYLFGPTQLYGYAGKASVEDPIVPTDAAELPAACRGARSRVR